MKHNRLKHEIDTPLEIINGWQFYKNEELFIKTGLGHYEYNFKTGEFTFNGKVIEMFPIIKAVAEWYEKDQKKHHIDTKTIEKAILKIELKKTAKPKDKHPSLFDRLFLKKMLSLIEKTHYEITTEMTIKTDEMLYSKKSGRGFL